MVKRYDVVIIPTPEVARAACELSQLVASRYDTCFILNDTNQVPHLSLYHFAAHEEKLSDIIEALGERFASQEAFMLQAVGYDRDNMPWLQALYERSEHLSNLHESVLEAVAPFHEKRKNYNQTEEWSTMSLVRKENLERYGWSEAGSLYKPHITLTRFDEAIDQDNIPPFPASMTSFMVTKLGLYELGDYGTCHNLLAQFNLNTPIV